MRLLILLTGYLLAATPLNVLAQVVPDNTLPNDTTVTTDEETINIRGGTVAGDNLFHSFEQFSLLLGETAFFDNASTIENIISRVTGGDISSIDGLIQANGAANLFLINPNGIVFGENAALDIGGSFVGSTAESLKFADGREFSAINPDAEPLLTVSIPVGLQYGSDSGDLTIRGTGNNLSLDPDTFTVDRSDRPNGLEVGSNRTLALVGGNVFLPGGNLTAAGGRVEIGSIDGNGLVRLTPNNSGWSLNYDEITDFQNISLSSAASIEVSGNRGGNVRLQGGTISITEGSAILADTLGDGAGGSFELNATAAIEILGFAADNFFPTRLSTDVDLGATGDGGDLAIATEYLLIADGAQVNSGTFDLGNAGNLMVEATDIEVIGESSDGEFVSGLFAQADFGETGNGGNLSIATDYLLVADGAQISTTTFGTGDAGNLNITASEIELTGTSGEFASGLLVSTEAEGNSGNLSIATDYLLVADGAQISTTTFGTGDAGNLNITASEVELAGASGEFASGLFVSTEAEGSGGSSDLETDYLLIANGAEISTTTFGAGNAGNLNITASEIELIGGAAGVGSSGLFANTEAGSSGSGGNITVNATSLSIEDGAQITALTDNSIGDAGTINIKTEETNLVGTSPSGNPSGIFASVLLSELETTGAGGDLAITTDRLEVMAGAQIGTSTSGSGDGGDLQIVAAESISLSGTGDNGSSGLFAVATSSSGAGGNINVTTDLLEILNQATISVSNFPSNDNSTLEPGRGAAGNLSIAASDIFMSDGSITADTFAGDRGNISLQTELLFLEQNSAISTNATGSATGGNIFINADDGFVVAVPQENNDITANAVFGNGGNVDIIARDIIGIEPQPSTTPFSDITASSEFGIMGSVTLQTQDLTPSVEIVKLSEALSPPQLDRGCLASGNNLATPSRFINVGRGGLLPQSGKSLNSNDLIGDVRVPRQWLEEESAFEDRPVEAQTWLVNERGKLELVSDLPEQITQLKCELRSP